MTQPTIGSNVEEVTYKNIKFQMWDLGGQESLRVSWATYYANTQAVFVVIDSTDRERIQIIREELTRMMDHDDLNGAALLVYANKQDLPSAMTAAEVSEALSLTSIKNHPWHIQACCAITEEGLKEGLDWVVDKLQNK